MAAILTATNIRSTGVTTLSLAYPGGGNTAGNCLVIFAMTNVTITGITDTANGALYTPVGNASITSNNYYCWILQNCAGGANTVTITYSGSTGSNDLTICEATGIPTGYEAILQFNTGGATGTSVTAPSQTILIPNTLSIGYVKAGTAITATGSWTLRSSASYFASVLDASGLTGANTIGAAIGSGGSAWQALYLVLASTTSQQTLTLGTKGEVIYDGNTSGTTGIYLHSFASNASYANVWDGMQTQIGSNWKGSWTGWLTNDGTGDYIGVDCSTAVQLTRIRYSAKPNYEDNLIGGYFQASNTSTFPATDRTNIAKITTRPNTGTMVNEISINLGGASFRYYRFLMAPNKGGRIADLMFFGSWVSGPGQTAQAVASPKGWHADVSTRVRLSSLTADAAIYYTTDGTTPTTSSTLYTGPFLISSSCQLQTLAVSSGLNNSDIASYNFYVQGEWKVADPQYDTTRNYLRWSVIPWYFYDPPSGFWYMTGYNFDDADGQIYGLPPHLYRSRDFVNWSWNGVVQGLDRAAGTLNGTNFLIDVPRILYNAANNNYVCWARDHGGGNVKSYVATAPGGPYTVVNSYAAWNGANLTASSDMSLFQDSNGDAYMLKGIANTSFMIIKLSADYQSLTNTYAWYTSWGGDEAWTMVHPTGGDYFLMYSGQQNFSPTLDPYVHTPTMIPATWGPTGQVNPFQPVPGGTPSNGNSYDTQVWQIILIPGRGPNAWMYVGARFDEIGTTNFSQHRHIILPVTFPTSTSMSISWMDSWHLDTVYPTVSGAPAKPTGLTVSSGVATWTNNETKAHHIYLDTADNALFTTNIQSEVLTSGSTSFTVAVPGNYYRIRAVNTSGTTSSDPFTTLPANFTLAISDTSSVNIGFAINYKLHFPMAIADTTRITMGYNAVTPIHFPMSIIDVTAIVMKYQSVTPIHFPMSVADYSQVLIAFRSVNPPQPGMTVLMSLFQD